MKPLLVVIALFTLTGCSVLQGNGTADQNEQAILSAGDAGALGCAALAVSLKPQELTQAKQATTAAQALLSSNPDINALSSVLTNAVPPKYVSISAALIARVRVRLGTAQLIPVDSVAFKMTEAFLNACSASLGTAV